MPTPKLPRRQFLKTSSATAALTAAGMSAGCWVGGVNRVSRALGTKVIVIGIDGMDPRLCENMMRDGLLPNLQKMARAGGFSPLATSMPPQSPVAWANFINGAGPGSHGIFDFIHRHPETFNDPNSKQKGVPFYSASETLPGEGAWKTGDYQVPLDFFPFNHTLPKTVLNRQGVPFWDFLDGQGVPSTFYDLPSNYPPSPSTHGHHRCISGMGTPDMTGGYGTYQYFTEDGPEQPLNEEGGRRVKLTFDRETARAEILGPKNSLRKDEREVTAEFKLHRDRIANAVIIQLQGQKLLLAPGQFSKWMKVTFTIDTPAPIPSQAISGIVRFYLQELSPVCKLYVSPVNVDPSNPAVQLSEPPTFITDVSKDLGLFYTTGFQEDHKARSNGVFVDDEYIKQAKIVLEERLRLFERALKDYDDGLLFFYFSSSDLQSHMFWWDSDEPHPYRDDPQTKKYFAHIKNLYQDLDRVVGDLYDKYGSSATIFVMSDHGFANFGRQFNLNSWLRDFGYMGPTDCTSVLSDVDWSQTYAYGLGINGLYLNLKGREANGIVEPGDEQKRLLRELKNRLQAVKDINGKKVIRNVYLAEEIYQGTATSLAPDLIVGYSRGYRASWETCLGGLTEQTMSDNKAAWSADHCADALEVPGMLCCNKPIKKPDPSLIDLAPSILELFGQKTPSSMTGRSVFV